MFILDTCAFFTQKHPDGEFFTAPGITNEIVNKQSKQYFENMLSTKLSVLKPKTISSEKVEMQAKETGDYDVLSKNDLEIIALGYELQGTIVTDDFAIQNVASALGLNFVSCSGKEITEQRVWKYKCTACNHRDKEKRSDCLVCGSKDIVRIKLR